MEEEFECPYCEQAINCLNYNAETIGTECGTAEIDWALLQDWPEQNYLPIRYYEAEETEIDESRAHQYTCPACSADLSENEILNAIRHRRISRERPANPQAELTHPPVNDIKTNESAKFIDPEKKQAEVSTIYGRMTYTYGNMTIGVSCPKCNNYFTAESEQKEFLCTNPKCGHEFQLSELIKKHNAE